jgi:dolichol kinase
MKYIGRKLFHLLGGIGLLAIYFISGRSRALGLYGVLVIIIFLAETARLKIPSWNRYLYARFKSFIRINEQDKLTGTIPYILGVGLSLYAYSVAVASAAICFLAFGDVAATTVGELYGRTKIGNKSLEGTAAFVVAAVCAGLVLISLGLEFKAWVMILGALIAAVIELLPIPVNDNFAIPVLSGAVMELMLRWTR